MLLSHPVFSARTYTGAVTPLCFLIFTFMRLGVAQPDNPSATPVALPFVTGEENNQHAAAIAEYGLTFECYERDDGLGICFQKQCQDACGIADDRIPQGCVQDGVSNKIKRDDEMAILGSVSCMIDKPWQSLDGSGEPIPGKRIRTGHCRCNDPTIAVIGDFFIDSVQKIGEILQKFFCPVLLAFDVIIEAGIAAIPGVGQAITAGMKLSIQVAKAAKMAYEGMDAASAFADIMLSGLMPSFSGQAGCTMAIPGRADILKKVYPPLSNVPDNVVPGFDPKDFPCGRGGGKKKADGKCEKDNSTNDPSDRPSSIPQNTERTTPSRSNTPSKTYASSQTNAPSQTNAVSQTNTPSPTAVPSTSFITSRSSTLASSSSSISTCRVRTRRRQAVLQRAPTGALYI